MFNGCFTGEIILQLYKKPEDDLRVFLYIYKVFTLRKPSKGLG